MSKLSVDSLISFGTYIGGRPRGVVKVDKKTGDVHANLTLPAGNVYTAWVIKCGDPDVFPCTVDQGATLGAGAEVLGNGRNAKWKFTILAANLPDGAGELHIINHGPDAGDNPDQYNTPYGECLPDYGTNQCSVALADIP